MALEELKINPQDSKIKCLLRKNILLLILYTSQTRYGRVYLPLPIRVIASIFAVSASIFLTLTPNIPTLFTAIPQHIIISSILWIGQTALLKTLHSYFR
jgi:hypothetical protein